MCFPSKLPIDLDATWRPTVLPPPQGVGAIIFPSKAWETHADITTDFSTQDLLRAKGFEKEGKQHLHSLKLF